jgi:hypothetical protein
MRFIISSAQLVLLASALLSHPSSASSAAAPATTTTSTNNGGGNVVLQLVGFVKDSVVRTVDGGKEMWGNHGKCKDIRSRQKDFRDKLKTQWEFEEQGLTPQEMRNRLQNVNGGITYDDFVFLNKGKEDRGKLMNVVFLMWGAPRIFPYAMMFYPDILPGPFAQQPRGSGKETKLEKFSRQRSHAVIQTLVSLENEARSIPALSKFNIFGKKKQERAMDMIDDLGKSAAKLMATPGARGGIGAQIVLNTLDNVLYTTDPLTRAEKRLVGVPKSIVLGLMTAINGPQPFTVVMPNFMRRGMVFSHAMKLMETDNFLVTEKVDLDSLSTAMLLEACNERMIGGPGRADDELRKGLTDWLDLAVVQPNNRTESTGENFNENLARSALMSYYSVEGTRDSRSTSYLPRLMFHGQMQQAPEERKR